MSRFYVELDFTDISLITEAMNQVVYGLQEHKAPDILKRDIDNKIRVLNEIISRLNSKTKQKVVD